MTTPPTGRPQPRDESASEDIHKQVDAVQDAAEPELGGATPPEADPDTEIPDDLERLADDGGETS